MRTHAESGRLPGVPAERHRRSGWPARLAAATVAGLALVAVGLVALPAAAAGSTLYVNASAACPGSGTQAAPYCTIKSAADTAQPGDTVRVAAGTYAETVVPTSSGTSGSPTVYQGDPGATVRAGTYGFQIASKSWITVRGFTITDTVKEGILVSGSDHITITGNRVTSAGTPAEGQIAQGIDLSSTNDSTVSGNVTDHNSEAGIQLSSGSTRNQVVGNDSSANDRGYVRAAPGIDVRAPGNSVIGNRAHDNSDTGIQSYSGAGNTLVANNLAWGNGDHGIDNLNAAGQRIIGNTVYDNVTAGINVEGSSTRATIANNVSVDNGYNIGQDPQRTKGNIRVDSNSTSGTTANYNLVYLSTPYVMYVWGSGSYSSLAAFKAATGQEANGIQADPRFVNAGAGDFHLGAGSPATDSANSGVSGQQSSDADGNPRVDDPGVANTGAGARAYDDRGALERQGASPPPANQPPVAALSVAPGSGPAPLTVTADASGSSDPDGTVVSYRFDFGDGAVVGPQTGASATHTYTAAANRTVTVTVTDDDGATDTAAASVTVTGGGGGGGGNLVGNPGFETDLTGWSATGVTRVAGGHSGSWAAQVATSSGSCTLNDSPNWVGSTSAGTYNGSLWVRADTGGATVKLRFREYRGSALVGSATTTATLGTGWQQVQVAYTVGTAGSTLDFNAYVSSPPAGTCFYADDASITGP